MSSFMLYSAPDAPGRARKAQEILQFRIDRLGLDIEEMRWDHIGLGAVHERRAAHLCRRAERSGASFRRALAVPGGACASVELSTVFHGPPGKTSSRRAVAVRPRS